jgi:hypothetical protein
MLLKFCVSATPTAGVPPALTYGADPGEARGPFARHPPYVVAGASFTDSSGFAFSVWNTTQ